MDEFTQKEGITLALGAISEVLNKQNTVLEKMLKKQEEEEIAEKIEEDEKCQVETKMALVKEIAAEVMKQLTNSGVLQKQDSKEIAAKVDSKPEKQQEVIQASVRKQDEEEKPLPEKTEEEKLEEEREREYPEVEKLRKEVEALKKSQAETIEKEVEDRLRKAGWREEKGSVIPKRVALGVDNQPMLKKDMSNEDKVGELAKLSYKELRRLEMQAEAEELPPEIKQFIS